MPSRVHRSHHPYHPHSTVHDHIKKLQAAGVPDCLICSRMASHMNSVPAVHPAKDNEEYGWIRRNVFWWTLPQNHPIHDRRTRGLQESLRKPLTQFGTSFVEFDREYPLPTSWVRFFMEKWWPGYYNEENTSPRVSDTWNKDGTHKEKD